MKKENGEFVSHVISKSWGYLRLGEIMLLKKLAKTLPENPTIINLGAGFGTSSLGMAEARQDAVLHTYDLRSGGPLGGLENERNAFKRADLPYPEQHLMDSSQGGREWDGPKLDLVFVDAGHKRPEVTADIEAWLPHIKNNGLMVFHDYGSRHHGAVKKVVDELMGDYETVAHEDCLLVKRIKYDEGLDKN
jgi:predicted O-methyltransferase YrrM